MQVFWQNVKTLTLGDKTLVFPKVSQFVENILSLPHSSANVERIFSSVNLLKTKQRNKLSSETITALLHTKQLIDKNTCYNFPVKDNLTAKMTSKALKNIQTEDVE